MAGNIQNVNNEKLNLDIQEYENLAENLHGCLINIHQDINEIKTYWTGKRINQLITRWNNSFDAIKANGTYFVVKIKAILMEIRNQYYSMESGKAADSSIGYEMGMGEIEKIELTDETTIKFEKENVESIVNKIETEISKAKQTLENLINQLDSIQNYSDSLKSLHSTYQNTAESVKQDLYTLGEGIQEELRQAINDVNSTEELNEADAKRAGSTTVD